MYVYSNNKVREAIYSRIWRHENGWMEHVLKGLREERKGGRYVIPFQ